MSVGFTADYAITIANVNETLGLPYTSVFTVHFPLTDESATNPNFDINCENAQDLTCKCCLRN